MTQKKEESVFKLAGQEFTIGSIKLLLVFILAEIFGIANVILVGNWVASYLGGFSWDYNYVNNYHIFFMTIGFVFLFGNGKSMFFFILMTLHTFF